MTDSDVRRILTTVWLLGAAVALYVYFFHREALEDLLSGAQWTWSEHNFVMLDAFAEPVHILHVKGQR